MRLIRSGIAWHILLYSTALAGLAILLNWMDFRHAMHRWSSEFYILCVALLFAAFGIWLGRQLAPPPRGSGFVRNSAAIRELGISPRELDVLGHLAGGASNKLIARRLDISPNTVKTHIARLFEKLDAGNRTEAIAKAREIDLLP
jgi:DNA-binding CsgD family transcriptional regulator